LNWSWKNIPSQSCSPRATGHGICSYFGAGLGGNALYLFDVVIN
jgi:hypothetical protein